MLESIHKISLNGTFYLKRLRSKIRTTVPLSIHKFLSYLRTFFIIQSRVNNHVLKLFKKRFTDGHWLLRSATFFDKKVLYDVQDQDGGTTSEKNTIVMVDIV